MIQITFNNLATDIITFKPFLKSRYSLRERRAKSTTRTPLIKSNETVLNNLSTEAETHDVTTQAPNQIQETTKAFMEKQFQDGQESKDINTITPAITTLSLPVTTTTTSSPETITPSVDKIITSTPRIIVNLENKVTEKNLLPDILTTKKIETTTQTEWVYD